ncbi:MAG: hypothetical protein J1F16_03295 [Muribaculaceae bacterium]|nr:hypothetical protein [Muribaculaceae bacterium]
MTDRKTFVKAVTDLVQEYIDNFDRFDSNPQIRVNPELLYVEIIDGSAMLEGIGDSEEAFEDAAYAVGDETMSASDYQEKQDPDFYPVKELLKPVAHNVSVPDTDKIEAIADEYFEKE